MRYLCLAGLTLQGLAKRFWVNNSKKKTYFKKIIITNAILRIYHSPLVNQNQLYPLVFHWGLEETRYLKAKKMELENLLLLSINKVIPRRIIIFKQNLIMI